MSIPNGIVIFLFTDVESGTKLAQEFPDKLQPEIEKHHTILNEVVKSHNGFIFEIIGDAFVQLLRIPKTL